METINNVDIGELGDASLPNTEALDRTPTESQRIEVLERELTFHRGKAKLGLDQTSNLSCVESNTYLGRPKLIKFDVDSDVELNVSN